MIGKSRSYRDREGCLNLASEEPFPKHLWSMRLIPSHGDDTHADKQKPHRSPCHSHANAIRYHRWPHATKPERDRERSGCRAG